MYYTSVKQNPVLNAYQPFMKMANLDIEKKDKKCTENFQINAKKKLRDLFASGINQY